MSANVTSTFDQNLGIVIAEDGAVVSIDTVEQSLSVIVGEIVSDESGMAVIIGGDATAVGMDTLAVANVGAIIAGDDDVQMAHGQASFTAIGEGDSSAYASAVSYGEILGEADYSIILNYSTLVTSQSQDEAVWTATSLTEVFALDLEGLPMGSSEASGELPVDDEPTTDAPSVEPPVEEEWTDCGCGQDHDWAVEIDGNLAIFNVAAVAIGDDSLATVELSAITIEDQLSLSTVIVTVAID